jgi:hypothetical protein
MSGWTGDTFLNNAPLMGLSGSSTLPRVAEDARYDSRSGFVGILLQADREAHLGLGGGFHVI